MQRARKVPPTQTTPPTAEHADTPLAAPAKRTYSRVMHFRHRRQLLRRQRSRRRRVLPPPRPATARATASTAHRGAVTSPLQRPRVGPPRALSVCGRGGDGSRGGAGDGSSGGSRARQRRHWQRRPWRRGGRCKRGGRAGATPPPSQEAVGKPRRRGGQPAGRRRRAGIPAAHRRARATAGCTRWRRLLPRPPGRWGAQQVRRGGRRRAAGRPSAAAAAASTVAAAAAAAAATPAATAVASRRRGGGGGRGSSGGSHFRR